MLLSDVQLLAENLLKKHSLLEWSFGFSRARRQVGVCKFQKKRIELSRYFAEKNCEEDILDTILHEIAHALAGPGTGHNALWRAVCQKIGAKPERCYKTGNLEMPQGRYQAICPNCQATHHRHRRPKKNVNYHCIKCGPELGKVEWVRKW